MKNRFCLRLNLILLIFIGILPACKAPKSDSLDLYLGFQNPPAEARPFVRWWWNGNKVTKDEISRELDVLQKAGFGGVEINPIAMPGGTKDVDVEALQWMSDEWIDMFVYACQKTKENGMIADAIVGSGWPFGGKFLKEDETCQRIVSHQIELKGNKVISLTKKELLDELFETYYGRNHKKRENETNELVYINLVSENIQNINNSIDLFDKVDEKGNLNCTMGEEGTYMLCYGFLQKNYMSVAAGAPGAAGPVMDHYKKETTLAYLSRLKRISEKTGIPLKDLLRALFCDSIEMAGANWTDGFASLFFEKYGYKLEPWFPFIFYPPNKGYTKPSFQDVFKEQLKRVRYDYNKLLVETFLSNFTQTFQEFCTENGLKCRYQAYGYPLLMGMLDGYMKVDIPESNNWLYSAEMNSDLWEWNQEHGYMIWNMYTASGAHLTGKNIVSCESMTNVRGVFKTSLEEIKLHDDMNFITGINHSVLHGFNYSPPEAGFPGWVRFGTYFSEQNPWWPYLNNWVNYNARLSYVFQNSQPDKSIAILGPTSDIWGDNGLLREPFHLKPWYLYKMWESISNLGYSCEYINENVLSQSDVSGGNIQYGPMNYKLLVLTAIRSMQPGTAQKINEYVKSGGKVVVTGSLPEQSLNFKEALNNDIIVREIFKDLQKNYPENVLLVEEPKSENELLSWVQATLEKTKLSPDVKISRANQSVYQIHQYTDDKHIYFFTNVHRNKTANLQVEFPANGNYAYLWNPETGKRTAYNFDIKPNQLDIVLDPLESKLIVFENEKPTTAIKTERPDYQEISIIDSPWNVEAKRVDGKIFQWNMEELEDLSVSGNFDKSSFAGTLIYKNKFNSIEGMAQLDLGDVNEGITEVFVNGKEAGLKWYGKAVFDISDLISEGENELEIKHSTVLANYCQSLKDNPVAKRWTNYTDITATGMEGPVRFLKE